MSDRATITLRLDAIPDMTPLGWRDYAYRFLRSEPQAQQLARAVADAIEAASQDGA